MKQMMAWMVTAASLTFSVPGAANQKDPRLDGLFERLQEAGTEKDAHDIEQTIWRIWTSSGNMDIDTLMAEGIVAMAREKFDRARDVFDEITRRAPDFAEEDSLEIALRVNVDASWIDGVRFSSTVIDCPIEEVEIGLPVELDWIERYGSPFPVFRPRSSAHTGGAS